jgi:hypothetical protein
MKRTSGRRENPHFMVSPNSVAGFYHRTDLQLQAIGTNQKDFSSTSCQLAPTALVPAQGYSADAGTPVQEDDNAHVEQKNWTHERKLLGWECYDPPEAVGAINAL